MALERLIQDGRNHPARIEDVVHKCEQELEVQIREGLTDILISVRG